MAKSYQEHLSIIEQCKETVRVSELKLKEALALAAVELSPVSVGDIVVINDYTHNGKNLRVESFYCRLYMDELTVSAKGVVQLKGGGDGKHTGHARLEAVK